jgi:hypothetical protein
LHHARADPAQSTVKIISGDKQKIEARIAMTARSRVLTPSPTALDLL